MRCLGRLAKPPSGRRPNPRPQKARVAVTPELFPFLIYALGGGAGLVSVVLAVRLIDQQRRDARRLVVTLRFPRNLTIKQVLAVVRTILGLAPATTGLVGRASVALEIIGT